MYLEQVELAQVDGGNGGPRPLEQQLDNLEAALSEGVLQHLAHRPRVVVRRRQVDEDAAREAGLIPLDGQQERPLHLVQVALEDLLGGRAHHLSAVELLRAPLLQALHGRRDARRDRIAGLAARQPAWGRRSEGDQEAIRRRSGGDQKAIRRRSGGDQEAIEKARFRRGGRAWWNMRLRKSAPRMAEDMFCCESSS